MSNENKGKRKVNKLAQEDSEINYKIRPKIKKKRKVRKSKKSTKKIDSKKSSINKSGSKSNSKNKKRSKPKKGQPTKRKTVKNNFQKVGLQRSLKEPPETSFDKYWYPRQNPKRSRQKKKKPKNPQTEQEVIWIIRHLHRLDRDEPHNWKNNPRYNQNFLDSPLTEFGKRSARAAGEEIVKNSPNLHKIKYIYTSPFTRCIQTSLEIAKAISDHTGKLVQLRIEYGLSEAVALHLEFLKVLDQSLFIDRVPILDFKLTINQITKDYYPYIDTKYKSLFKKSDIILETVKDTAERVVKTMNYLTNHYKNMVICSHQIPVTIANMFLYNRPYPLAYLYKINPLTKDKKNMDPKRLSSYGILSGFQKEPERWKYIYPPDNEYFQNVKE